MFKVSVVFVGYWLTYILFVLLFCTVAAIPACFLWNGFAPSVFVGVKEINFAQAWCMIVLARVVFGRPSPCSSSRE